LWRNSWSFLVVIRDISHHIVQRGNRRQTTFFCDDDYMAYWVSPELVEKNKDIFTS
jgi:hypothetical protein